MLGLCCFREYIAALSRCARAQIQVLIVPSRRMIPSISALITVSSASPSSSAERLPNARGRNAHLPAGINISEYRRVSQNISEHLRTSQSISEYLRVSQNISECLRVSQSISEHRRVSQSISEHLRTSQNISAHRISTHLFAASCTTEWRTRGLPATDGHSSCSPKVREAQARELRHAPTETDRNQTETNGRGTTSTLSGDRLRAHRIRCAALDPRKHGEREH
eukprot:SAG31_NODE_1363_length_8627_cov_5.967402_2_plen_223_part_00